MPPTISCVPLHAAILVGVISLDRTSHVPVPALSLIQGLFDKPMQPPAYESCYLEDPVGVAVCMHHATTNVCNDHS